MFSQPLQHYQKRFCVDESEERPGFRLTEGSSSVPHPENSPGLSDEGATVEPKRPLVIERPELQTFPQRWSYRSVTVLCWLL